MKKRIKEYDLVELLVEKEEYAEHGIHKGEIGCVMELYGRSAAEVDFSGFDENGNFYGDCFSFPLSELKLVEKK